MRLMPLRLPRTTLTTILIVAHFQQGAIHTFCNPSLLWIVRTRFHVLDSLTFQVYGEGIIPILSTAIEKEKLNFMTRMTFYHVVVLLESRKDVHFKSDMAHSGSMRHFSYEGYIVFRTSFWGSHKLSKLFNCKCIVSFAKGHETNILSFESVRSFIVTDL